MNLEISRRGLLQASSLLGLAYLVGCEAAPRDEDAAVVMHAGSDPHPPHDQHPATEGGVDQLAIPWPQTPASPVQSAPAQVIFPSAIAALPPTMGTAPLPTFQPSVPSFPGVLSRSQWTRSGVARPTQVNPMGAVTRITIHHDGMDAFTASGQGACANRIETIRVSHLGRSAKGGGRWADIGYHFVIDPAGRIWEGRSLRYQGAHVQDHNENNIGVVCLGNYERQAPSRGTREAVDRFIASLMRQYNIPLSRVYTHKELNPTQCPGRNLQRYLETTRSRGGGMALACARLGIPALAMA